LLEWIGQEKYTHVGMESTGVYWMTVYRRLEGFFELIVANAQHIKGVPGRKVRREVAEIIAPESNEAFREPAVPPAVILGSEAGR